jgi:ATP-dependent RNA helicase RhlE
MPHSAETQTAAKTGQARAAPRFLVGDTRSTEETQIPSFRELRLAGPLLRAVSDEGYERPTPIQVRAIPHLLAGRDLLGWAQTGSGKTAAFALPIIQRLSSSCRAGAGGRPSVGWKRGNARALVLSPTRELAVQIAESFRAYGRHVSPSVALVHGGVSQVPQVKAVRRGVDVLVATPGRLLDLIGQRHVRLDAVEVFVLDEADRMLDMGFIPDVLRIIGMLPKRRQSLFFGATMPPRVTALADDMLTEPVVVDLAPRQVTADNIDQKVMLVERENKRKLLCRMLEAPEVVRALVFTRTKHKADSLARILRRERIRAEAIHGNRPQAARQKALDGFREGRTHVLVATDVAARGIDVEGVTHVFNFEIPVEAEMYVHRIGRTARAGAAGVAYSFCDVSERSNLYDIEKLIRRPLPVVEDHPFRSQVPYIAAGSLVVGSGRRGGVRPSPRRGRRLMRRV